MAVNAADSTEQRAAGSAPEGEGTVELLTLSVFELDHLCALKGVPTPSAVANAVDGVAASNPSLSQVVNAGLRARGMVTASDSEMALDPGIDELVGFLAAPGLVVRIESDSGATAVVHTIYATPERALLESTDGPACLTYRAFDLDALIPFVINATALTEQPAPDTDMSLSVSASVIMAASEAAAAGDVDASVALLSDAGAGPQVARSYVEALTGHQRASHSVALTHRVNGAHCSTLVAWADCGDAGLWLIEQPDALQLYARARRDDPDMPADVMASTVHVRAVGGAALLDMVLAGLPGA